MVEARTALGSYLLTKRITRDCDSISGYLAKYGVTDILSESYYRDLESGRKLIRIQSASELCEKLNLDKRAFYYFLLKDLIPDDVFAQIISASAIDTFKSAAERAQKLETNNKEFGQAILTLISDDVTDLDDDCLDTLEKDFALLAVLHFIYNRNVCSFDEIDEIYRECGGVCSISLSIEKLLGDKIVVVDKTKKTVSRRSSEIRVVNSDRGRAFKNRFTEFEIHKSLQKRKVSKVSNGDGTVQYSVIVPLSRSTVESVEVEGIGKLIAAIKSDNSSLDDEGVRPFYVGIMLSTRDEYNIVRQKQEERRNRK